MRTVYVKDSVKKVVIKVREKVEERKREKGWVIGGDFNARKTEEGTLEDRENGIRKMSADKVINKQEEELIRWVGEER